MTSKLKKPDFLIIYWIFTLLINTFSLFPEQAHALSCGFPPSNIFIYCQKNACDGFILGYVTTGNECDVRSVLIEGENFKPILYSILGNLKQKPSTGVYRYAVFSSCTEKWNPKYCSPEQIAYMHKISEKVNIQQLEKFKSTMRKQEKKDILNAAIKKWGFIFLTITITLIGIIWPWIILWSRKPLKHIGRLFGLAIVTQTLFILYLFSQYPYLIWSYKVWRSVVSNSLLALLVSIVVEIVYLVYRKVRNHI